MKRTTLAIFLWALILSGLNATGIIPEWPLYVVVIGGMVWISVREAIAR